MAIMKYNPIRDLRTMQEQMNRLLDLAWSRESGEDLREGVWQPAVDIFEDSEAVVIKAELPDVDQQDIEVKIESNTLTLRGERKLDQSIKKENFHRIERYYGSFIRTFVLPTIIDQDRINAVSERGVLTITLPKKEGSKTRHIEIEMK